MADGSRIARGAGWLGRYGAGAALFVVGLAMLAIVLFSTQPAGVETTLVVIGAALMILGALGSRLVDELEVGPSGIRTKLLASAKEVAEDAGLPPVEVEERLNEMRRDLDDLAKPKQKGALREAIRKAEAEEEGHKKKVERDALMAEAARRMTVQITPELREQVRKAAATINYSISPELREQARKAAQALGQAKARNQDEEPK